MSQQCSRVNCVDVGVKSHASGRQRYCEYHSRVLQMVGSSNKRYGTKLTMDQVESLLTQFISENGMTCSACRCSMRLSGQAYGISNTISIQHWEDGSMGFLCCGCNGRHGKGSFDIPVGKRKCLECSKILSLSKFVKDASRNSGHGYRCFECQRQYSCAMSKKYSDIDNSKIDITQLRVCSGCKQDKMLSEFGKDKIRKLGRSYICNICRRV